jgi:hypothetical protein
MEEVAEYGFNYLGIGRKENIVSDSVLLATINL